MRRITMWLAAFAAIAVTSTPSFAAELVATPAAPTGYWAGTRLKIVAERASAGRLRVRVTGAVSVKSRARVSIALYGCAAGTDSISSYSWTPEHHPLGRQAIPGSPAYQSHAQRSQLWVQGDRHVSYAATVGYGFPEAPAWTDCVGLLLSRTANDGREFSPAFDIQASTLYMTVGLQDGRHAACGLAPAFCSAQRPTEFPPPALPDFPPAGGYPGSPGHGEPLGEPGLHYPYHVCPIGDQRYVLCTAEQAAAAAAA